MKRGYSPLDVLCFHAFIRLPTRFTDLKPVMNFVLPRAGRYAYDESHLVAGIVEPFYARALQLLLGDKP